LSDAQSGAAPGVAGEPHKQCQRPFAPSKKRKTIMSNRKILAAILLLGATVAPVASSAAPAAAKPASCILGEHRIIAIAPYVVEGPRGPREIHEGRAAVRELRGATIFVQAEPGLTPEWLQLTLSRRIAEGMKGCAFGAHDIQVKVTSTGTDFGVYLVARDPRKAQEVLRLARLLVG
jgi:hypothetical protein